jgi:YD repeat-containing protein
MLRFKCLLLGVVLIGGILQLGSTPAHALQVRCDGSVLVIGARGSGERARPRTLRMGNTAYDVYRTLADLAPSLSLQPLGLDYPAVSVPSAIATAGALYQRSYARGVSRLREELEQHAAECREQRFVLIGYSQGAHVVGDVVAGLDPARALDREILARIAGVVMFGDPRYNREDTRVNVGGRRLNGVFDQWGLAVSPTSRPLVGRRGIYQQPPASRVHSYCLAGDLVCNWSSSNAVGCLGVAWVPILGAVPIFRPSCAHLHYTDDMTFRAGVFLNRQMRQALLGPPRITTASLPPAIVGSSYRQALRATGGRSPYRWSLASGELPAGLALTPAGIIEGTPTQAEGRCFQVRVRDANWRTVTRRLVLVVNASPPTGCGTGAGTVAAWGNNDSGELGNGTTIRSSTPVPVSGLAEVAAVAGGSDHSLALRTDGTVWAWGYKGLGALGDGTRTDSSTPVPVSGLTEVTAIAAGHSHSLAVRADGTVWAWGSNRLGQLGDGTQSDSSTPVRVAGLSEVVAVSGGGDHSLALRADGTVWAWGYNAYGQLGNPTPTDGSTANWSTTPLAVSDLSAVTAIAASGYFNLALRTDGTVWAWGYNGFGQLGDGTTTDSWRPVPASGLSEVTAIAAGPAGSHALALRTDGTVWAWGHDGYDQLGYRKTTAASPPVAVSGLSGVTAIAAGDQQSLALRVDSTAWQWGATWTGDLGSGTSPTPSQVEGLSRGAAIAAGSDFNLVVET